MIVGAEQRHAEERPRRPSTFDRWVAGLTRSLSTRRCRASWAVATLLLLTSIAVWFSFNPHGIIGDFNETTVPSFAIARGDLQCAYPAASELPVPPLYPMVAASVIALTGRTNMHIETFGPAGKRCPAVGVAIRWPNPVLFLWPVGLFAWAVLLAGYVLLVRASGWGRTRLEIVGACLLACVPALAGTLIEYFHPEDLLAMGLLLGALAAHLRKRWLVAGILIGLACCAKQYAVLAAVPLLIVTPGRDRWRFLLGSVGISTVLLVPLGLAMGRGMWDAVLGTTSTPPGSSTFVAWLGLKGAARIFVSRGCPLIMAGAIALWARWRLSEAVLRPLILTSLIATSLALRLVFEVSFFDYYLMALSVALILMDVVDGTIRIQTIGWIVFAGALFPPEFEPIVLAVDRHTVPVQVLVAISGLLLAVRPLWRASRASAAIRAPDQPPRPLGALSGARPIAG